MSEDSAKDETDVGKDSRAIVKIGPPLSHLYRAAILFVVTGITWWAGANGTGAFSWVVGGVAAAVGVLTLFERVVIGSDLRVRNTLRWYRLPWTKIDQVRYTERPFMAGLSIGANWHTVEIRLRGGSRWIPLSATQSTRGGLASPRLFGDAPTVSYEHLIQERVEAATEN